MAMARKKNKVPLLTRIENRLDKSPIDYFSDLFIVAMVAYWMIDIAWESLIATAVTISSIFLSFQAGYNCIDTTMWSSIGSNATLPLSIGGGVWLLKCGFQHVMAASKDTVCDPDFPDIPDADFTITEDPPESSEELG